MTAATTKPSVKRASKKVIASSLVFVLVIGAALACAGVQMIWRSSPATVVAKQIQPLPEPSAPLSISPYTEKAPSAVAANTSTNRRQELPPVFADPAKAARQEREQYIAEIQQSGRTQGTWPTNAERAFSGVALDVSKFGIQVSSSECWASACYVKVRYQDINSFRETRKPVMDEFINKWPAGGKSLTGPEVQPNGEVVSYWILRQPDA